MTVREERLMQLQEHYIIQQQRIQVGLPPEPIPEPSVEFKSAYDRTGFDVFECLTRLCIAHGDAGKRAVRLIYGI